MRWYKNKKSRFTSLKQKSGIPLLISQGNEVNEYVFRENRCTIMERIKCISVLCGIFLVGFSALVVTFEMYDLIDVVSSMLQLILISIFFGKRFFLFCT